MRSLPTSVTESSIIEVVTEKWGIEPAEVRYIPEGAGAYHWLARQPNGARWFVTCDDLDTKPWLGSDRDEVFLGLDAAYRTAAALHAAGRTFVAAATASRSGAVAERVNERHSVSVFEFIDGAAGQWGQPLPAGWQDELLAMLAALHRSPVHTLRRRGLEVPDRDLLVGALADVDARWDAGPLSDSARRVLAPHVETIVGWLAELDDLATSANDVERDVVTHGEPHPGNLLASEHGLVLVDWDTVAMGPPERDLWMLAAIDASAVTAYESLSGMSLDVELLRGYRMLWALNDVVAFTAEMRRDHTDNIDTRRAIAGLTSLLERGEPLPYGPG